MQILFRAKIGFVNFSKSDKSLVGGEFLRGSLICAIYSHRLDKFIIRRQRVIFSVAGSSSQEDDAVYAHTHSE